MTILVTGASGSLGRLVLDDLLARGVEPTAVRAGARRTDSLAAHADLGVDVVELDYDRPDTVKAAVDGADRVLLISGNEFGKRVDQHRAVIDAAAAAGVGHLLYTSVTRADDTTIVVAPEHTATEEILGDAGLPVTVLRNNFYTEVFGSALDGARATGTVLTSAGEGRVASASRADFAEAAAVALTGDVPTGVQVLELAGDQRWSRDDLAAAAAEVLGRDVRVEQVSSDEHRARLLDLGVDAGTVGFLVELDQNIRDGELDITDGTLARLLGRPTTPLIDTLRAL
ncbi:NAD(P)H dehydrogenase (quinone) [Actinomycetospora succinea]|uniref:NAD(P)H dehydrogenase (Quinone) n=1 Tax=Actinomycetospora succinea TaxID=663603 RepID=A0A4R6UJC4_9PSEU|nr:NmrA family NAD(P)-binding protein [Actinomycetospora succinea]TDQ47040.1 NAD(P)H dehydrogenase (quinone) [Actinomycetospora succinea]